MNDLSWVFLERRLFLEDKSDLPPPRPSCWDTQSRLLIGWLAPEETAYWLKMGGAAVEGGGPCACCGWSAASADAACRHWGGYITPSYFD